MATLTLDTKYIDVLQALGNLEETLEEAVRRYAVRVMKNKMKDWIDNSKTYRYKTYLNSKELRELTELLKSN